jgi:hypothetical protein
LAETKSAKQPRAQAGVEKADLGMPQSEPHNAIEAETKV